MNKYLLNLFTQFNESTGFKTVDFNDPIYLEEFINWIKMTKGNGNRYQKFIEYLGINIDNFDTTELRKGKYDSIALPNTKIISPFGSSLGKDDEDIIMFQGEPLLVGSKKITREQVAGTYMTHNPYSLYYLNSFDYFYETGINFCIGIYGNIQDRNKFKKIKQLKEYKKRFLPNALEEYEIFNETYFYIIKNKKNTKTKSKILIK